MSNDDNYSIGGGFNTGADQIDIGGVTFDTSAMYGPPIDLAGDGFVNGSMYGPPSDLAGDNFINGSVFGPPGDMATEPNIASQIADFGKSIRDKWDTLDRDEKKFLMSLGGGLLGNVFKMQQDESAAKKAMDAQKELLAEKARLDKESEDRKMRRSAHAPVGTQFADTGLLNTVMGKR